MLKRLVLRLLPPAAAGRLRSVWRRVLGHVDSHRLVRQARSWRMRGDVVYCVVCERWFRRFVPFRDRPEARCPWCHALERHRALWLVLRGTEGLFRDPTRLLHLAPELALELRFRAMPIVYVRADYVGTGVDVRLDVQRLPFMDQSFEGIVEVHVLQNVRDDRQALRELCRVLRPGGWLLVTESVHPSRPETVEDRSIVDDPARRASRYGFEEYRRLYGTDIAGRIREAGFLVEALEPWAKLDEPTRRRFGVDRTVVHLCRRGGARAQ